MPVFEVENVFGKLGSEGGIKYTFISASWPPPPNLTFQFSDSLHLARPGLHHSEQAFYHHPT